MPRRRRLCVSTLLSFVLAGLTAFPQAVAGQPAAALVRLSDEAGDDDGPGTYRLPRGAAFAAGRFDLREVTLRANADATVTLTVQMGATLPIARKVRVAREDWRDVLLLQVDLYIDTDAVPGSGHTRTVPGRRVLVDAADAWERAVVLTDLPDRVSTALLRAAPDLHAKTTVVAPTSRTGRTMSVTLPAAALGGAPRPEWGYTVLVTSVTLAGSLRAIVFERDDTANVFTRDVTHTPGSCHQWEEEADGHPCTFGGCDPCGATHPRVIDALVGHPQGSRAELARYGADRVATLTAFRPAGARPATAGAPLAAPPAPMPPDLTVAALCPGGGRFPVAFAEAGLVTVQATSRDQLEGMEAGRIAALLLADGRRGGRAMVVRRSGLLLALEVVGEADPTTPAAVSFRCADGTEP